MKECKSVHIMSERRVFSVSCIISTETKRSNFSLNSAILALLAMFILILIDGLHTAKLKNTNWTRRDAARKAAWASWASCPIEEFFFSHLLYHNTSTISTQAADKIQLEDWNLCTIQQFKLHNLCFLQIMSSLH